MLVYVVDTPHETIFSRRIRGAFSSWPPEVGEPVEHVQVDLGNSVDDLFGFDDGTFALQTGRGCFFGKVDTPGVIFHLQGRVFPQPAGPGVYAVVYESDRSRLTHRSTRCEEANVIDLGVIPPRSGHVGAATEAGGLVLVGMGREPEDAAVAWFVEDGAIRRGASLGPSGHRRHFAVPRPGGGVFIVPLLGRDTGYAIDERGALVGTPWLPDASRGSIVAGARWSQGLALVAVRGESGRSVILSDTVGTTRSEGRQLSATPVSERSSLASSRDGRVLLFAYPDMRNAGLARLVCGTEESLRDFAPPPEDAVVPRAVAAPTRVPGSPPAPEASPYASRDEIVRRIRVRRVLDACMSIHGASIFGDVMAEGDDNAGWYSVSDGCGNHVVLHWDESGVVGLGFDHDSGESEWPAVARDQRDPGKYLSKLPAVLTPLGQRATDWGERLATEGFWLTADEARAHGSSCSTEQVTRLVGDVVAARVPQSAEPPDDSQPMAYTLAKRMAETATYVMRPEDEAVLFGAVKDVVLDPTRVADAVKVLAALGIEWPDAVSHARVHAAAQQRAKDARTSAPNRALFRAADAGDLDAVKEALAAGADLDCPMPKDELPATPDSATPLVLALRKGHVAVANHLLGAGASVTASTVGRGGSTDPLRLAAERGNVEMTRRLLELGASVRADEPNWGLLQQVMCAPPWGPRGTPSDYAEVIRLLLDKGAPLPNDANCSALARMAEAGGAPDLVPRLFRVYAEDVVPDVGPAPDTRANAPRVSELLRGAAADMRRDTAAALRQLTDAWRLSLNPRIGDAAETLARQTRGHAVAGVAFGSHGATVTEATAVALRAAREAAARDPRTARALLEWLWTSDIYARREWVAKCEDLAAAILVELRDVRFTESLAQHCQLGRQHASLPLRPSLRAALRALEETVPGPLTDEDVGVLGSIEDTVAHRKPHAGLPSTRDLFEAVYAAPDDDQPRRRLAERLTDAGDPRGELITLQLDRHAAGTKATPREAELLAENARPWLGELISLLYDVEYERGFPAKAATGDGSEGEARSWPLFASGHGTQIEWSTITSLSMARHASIGTRGLLLGSRLAGLRELVGVGMADFGALLSRDRPALEHLALAGGSNAARWSETITAHAGAIPARMPSLKRLRIAAPLGVLETIVGGLAKLEELSVDVGADVDCFEALLAMAEARGLA
ncbi:MAG TPA: ankyrin repeat domain-containing protein, partial [Polyangiaceae bacterium]|nr:ankyrin repeat domain-containing protein [Polyangiaceae bacterium]